MIHIPKLQLIVILLASNKKSDCEVWIKENMSELLSLSTHTGDSMLHLIPTIEVGPFDFKPMLRMLVTEGKMDVNVVNKFRQTPLHLLSRRLHFLLSFHLRTEKILGVAELLIDNGAHMDAVDNIGMEASYYLSQRFPKWAFNFSLKCLAARAILKHGVRYEKMPDMLEAFIQSHKAQGVSECRDD